MKPSSISLVAATFALQVNPVVLICIDPPLPPNITPRITFQLWRLVVHAHPPCPSSAQPRIAEVVQNDDWTLNATPVQIPLSDIFGVPVPAACGHKYSAASAKDYQPGHKLVAKPPLGLTRAWPTSDLVSHRPAKIGCQP